MMQADGDDEGWPHTLPKSLAWAMGIDTPEHPGHFDYHYRRVNEHSGQAFEVLLKEEVDMEDGENQGLWCAVFTLGSE